MGRDGCSVDGGEADVFDGKSKLADHVFPKAARGRTDDRRSRAHLFVADHFLLMYRRPRRFRMRNEMASRNLSSVIYDAPCRTGVPIVTTNTPIERRIALSILSPPYIGNDPPESFSPGFVLPSVLSFYAFFFLFSSLSSSCTIVYKEVSMEEVLTVIEPPRMYYVLDICMSLSLRLNWL